MTLHSSREWEILRFAFLVMRKKARSDPSVCFALVGRIVLGAVPFGEFVWIRINGELKGAGDPNGPAFLWDLKLAVKIGPGTNGLIQYGGLGPEHQGRTCRSRCRHAPRQTRAAGRNVSD